MSRDICPIDIEAINKLLDAARDGRVRSAKRLKELEASMNCVRKKRITLGYDEVRPSCDEKDPSRNEKETLPEIPEANAQPPKKNPVTTYALQPGSTETVNQRASGRYCYVNPVRRKRSKAT
jgi:hypothetical protein